MKAETFRIDIHHHIVPPIYLTSLAKFDITKVSRSRFPNWNPEQSLELMNRQNIAMALTSISSPGIFFGDYPEHFRISLVSDRMEEAILKMGNVLDSLVNPL